MRNFASEQLLQCDYFECLSKKKSIEISYNENLREIADMNIEKNKLENKLSNEALGSSEFNDELCKFLGYKDITLSFNKIKNGMIYCVIIKKMLKD